MRLSAVYPQVPGVARGYVRSSSDHRLPLGWPILDDALGGGLPRGGLTEIIGERTSGRTTLAHAAVAGATTAGALAAWIDVPHAFDPASAEAVGTDVSRVLWIAPRERMGALRAAEQVLALDGFWVVVIDLDAPAAIPAGMWLRLCRAARDRDTAVVLLATASIVGPFATMELEAHAARRLFVGTNGPCPIFDGVTSGVKIQKAKGTPLPAAPIEVFLSSDGDKRQMPADPALAPKVRL